MSNVSERVAELVDPAVIKALVLEARKTGRPGGVEELINQMTKAVLEKALEEEMSDHLGYESGDPAGIGSLNVRNGHSDKTVATSSGKVDIRIPRDRKSQFTPVVVPKHVRRLGRVEDAILSLYARGVTTRDVKSHMEEIYGVDVSPALVSRVTDVVEEEITQWRNRPLDEVYPIVYLDAIWLKIRDEGAVRNMACHIALGVDVSGRKHVLGLWIAKTEGARFWVCVLTDLRNRGVNDILILVCDGLTGLPDAVEAIFPNTTVQTCVVHLLRQAMKYASYKDRKAMAASMRHIYTAPTLTAAEEAFTAFKQKWQKTAPGAVMSWERAWTTFTPFLDFPTEIRKVIYTTNAIESLNYQLRKITKTHGSFPSEDAATKLLYLGIRNIQTHRGGELGTGTTGWSQALNLFAIQYPDRLPL